MRFNVVVILVALTMTLGPGCTKADSGDDTRPADRAPKTSPTTTSTTPEAVVTDGKEVSVGLDGTTVTVPAGSAPGGSRIVISSATAPQPADQFPGDAVDISIDAELTGPVTIVMAYDPDDLEPDVEPMLYTWVPETSSWLPQAATVDPKAKTLSATTQHLSTWTWGTPYYLWGKVTGDRTDPPTCSGKAPSWVKNFDHQDDPNAAVSSCIENRGDELRLKLRANRGIPILVEFTTPVTVVDGSLESKTITAETLKRWPNRVYIGARQELIVTFPNPNRVVAISAKRWGGAATRFGLYAITTFYEQSIGADGKLNVLPQVLKCMWDIKELSDANSAADATGSVLSALTSCIERQLEGLRASGSIDGVQFTRLSQAFGYWKFADEFTKAVDTGFFDGDDDKYAYLSILTRKPAPAGPTSILDRTPRPDDCMVRYLVMYRTAEEMGIGSDDLGWYVPWDEIPGSGIGRAATRGGVTVLMRNSSGRLQRSDLTRLSGYINDTNDPGAFVLCGEAQAGIYWIEQGPPSDLPGNDDRVTLEGVGPLQVGASFGAAELATGHPMQRHYPMLGDDESCINASFGGGNDTGITILGGDGRIRRIDINEPSAIRTKSGIGIGSSEADVKAAYPGRIEVMTHEYVADGHYLVYRPADTPDRMMVFETDGAKVTAYRVGDGEFTQYVEGCL